MGLGVEGVWVLIGGLGFDSDGVGVGLRAELGGGARAPLQSFRSGEHEAWSVD